MNERRGVRLEYSPFERFPAPLRSALRLIENNATCEESRVLLLFTASFAHVDFVCNLAMLEMLPTEYKKAALDMFVHCLTSGLSIQERGALLEFITPYLHPLGKPR